MMTTHRKTQRPMLDPTGIAGMVIVGVAAAVLSFSTWVHLAEAVGFGSRCTILGVTLRLAWLLPIAIDCYTVTVIRVWLRSPAGSAVLTYAKANALAAIVLSVAGQAAFHAFSAAGVKMVNLWWFAIIIGGIPPALLGLVMDLYTRMKHEADSPVVDVPAPVVAPVGVAPQQAADLPVAPVTGSPVAAATAPKPAATRRATKPATPRKTTPVKAATKHAEPPATAPATPPVEARNDEPGERNDDQLYAIIRPLVAGATEPPSQRKLYEAIKSGTGRGAGYPKIAELVERAQREAQPTSVAAPAVEPAKTNGHAVPDLIPSGGTQ
jgi:hypothetical protein